MAIESRTIRKGITLLLAAYWLILFVATHLPRVPQAFNSPGADKWQHIAAFAALAALLTAHQSLKRFRTGKLALTVITIVALYGIFDELTQIPAGRDAEVADWLADVAGAAIGISAFIVLPAWLTGRQR